MIEQEIDVVLAALQSNENTPESTFIVIRSLTETCTDGTSSAAPKLKDAVPSEEAPEPASDVPESTIPKRTRSKVAGIKPKQPMLKKTSHRRIAVKGAAPTESDSNLKKDQPRNPNWISRRQQNRPLNLILTGPIC